MKANTDYKTVAHAAICAYAAQIGAPTSSIRRDGSFTLLIDGLYRVSMHSMPDGRIALGSRLLSLQGTATAFKKEQVLANLLCLSAGMLRDYASTLCVDEARSTLLLQQILLANTDVFKLKKALTEFVNSLGFWTRICAKQGLE